MLTGFASNGQLIPLPAGFAREQCSIGVSNATNAHMQRPNYFAGGFANISGSRTMRCGFYDEWNFYARGQCLYVVSCS